MATKKPRKIKENSVVNSVTMQDVPILKEQPPITKDKMSMEERNIKTDEDIKNIDLSSYKEEEIPKIHQFIASLTSDEKKAMLIAIDHLGSSFDIVRCNHYKSWAK